ncbi:MAG: hypothetical protein AAGK14_15135 [Verrucomicrobiota bacterium]
MFSPSKYQRRKDAAGTIEFIVTDERHQTSIRKKDGIVIMKPSIVLFLVNLAVGLVAMAFCFVVIYAQYCGLLFYLIAGVCVLTASIAVIGISLLFRAISRKRVVFDPFHQTVELWFLSEKIRFDEIEHIEARNGTSGRTRFLSELILVTRGENAMEYHLHTGSRATVRMLAKKLSEVSHLEVRETKVGSNRD